MPIGIKPEGDKLVRMEAQCARFEAGQVHFPKEAPWLSDSCTRSWPSQTRAMTIRSIAFRSFSIGRKQIASNNQPLRVRQLLFTAEKRRHREWIRAAILVRLLGKVVVYDDRRRDGDQRHEAD